MSAPKRKRTDDAFPALAASMAARSKAIGLQLSDYHRGGKGYLKKVVTPNAYTTARYGPSKRLANQEQRQHRAVDGYFGAGRYSKRKHHGKRKHGRNYRYRGDGGFWGDVWSGIKTVGRAALPIASQFVPSKFAPLLQVGENLLNNHHGSHDDYDDTGDYGGEGDYMEGMGDYGPVNSNAIVHGVPSNPSGIAVHTMPSNAMSDTGDIMLSHKEFICNITVSASTATSGQSTFANQVFPLNPGLQSTFPFLSQIAQCFTLYSMQGLMFQYKPTSGEMGINSQQLGKVIMATDYDPQATPFINAVQMENYQFSNSAKPSIGQIHGVECKPAASLLDMKYTRTGKTSRDLALTDIGLFQIATEGIPLPTNYQYGQQIVIGELWASYSVKVSRANLYASLLGQNIAFTRMNSSWANVPAAREYKSTATPTILPSDVWLSQYANIALQDSNTLGVTPTFYNAMTNSTNTVELWQNIVLEWPAQTILGSYEVTITYQCSNAGVPGTFIPSALNVVSGPTQAILNSSNRISQWVCPYSNRLQKNNAGVETIVDAPSVNTSTSLAGFLPSPTSQSNNLELTKVHTSLLEAGGYAFAMPNPTAVPASVLGQVPGFTSVTQFNVLINAPGISIPTLVLEYYGTPTPYIGWGNDDYISINIVQINNGTAL